MMTRSSEVAARLRISISIVHPRCKTGAHQLPQIVNLCKRILQTLTRFSVRCVFVHTIANAICGFRCAHAWPWMQITVSSQNCNEFGMSRIVPLNLEYVSQYYFLTRDKLFLIILLYSWTTFWCNKSIIPTIENFC